MPEREAQPVRERQASSGRPGDGGLLGVGDGDRLEVEVVAGEQRAGQAPVAAVRPDLLGNLGPVGGAAGSAGAQASLDGRGAVLTPIMSIPAIVVIAAIAVSCLAESCPFESVLPKPEPIPKLSS